MSEVIDNRTRRQEILRRLIRQLHQGKSVEEVKSEFAALLRDVGAGEIAELEQALVDEGIPEMEIKRLCDVHVAVFRESLDQQVKPETVPGHPVHTLLAENGAALRALDALGSALEVLRAEPSPAQLERARERLRKLQEYDKHYLREENLLFPYLEKHGFAGPSSVMWAIHDDVRAGWKALAELLEAGPSDVDRFGARVDEIFGPLSTPNREKFYKEENILYPTAVERLGEEEWLTIRAQEPEIGYCYVEPGDRWPPTTVPPEIVPKSDEVKETVSGPLLYLDTGTLTPQEINWLLTHLPIDITYVDKDDTVRFFSQTRERIFPRSPAVIGRKVQKCHPPASLHRVQRILDDFRTGARDEAEFWIQMQGRFVHIRYFAVRDEQGEYQGTLEVTQDVTEIRALEGERRLLGKEE
jgi:DUF438 domain-containing protein